MRHRLWLAGLVVACVGMATPANAVSITFDFLHPNGVGSSFADAVPLWTSGAAMDALGNPIGFTQINSGDPDSDRQLAAFLLTSRGLLVRAGPGIDNAVVGIPSATSGTGTTRITARFTDILDVNTTWEQFGIGWGPTSTSGTGDMVKALLYAGGPGSAGLPGTPRLQARSTWGSNMSDLNPCPLPNLAQTITIRKQSNTQFRAEYALPSPGAATGNVTDDVSGGTLNTSGAYGFLYTSHSGASDPMTGMLTSITFEGPNVAAPTSGAPRAFSYASYTLDFQHPSGTGSAFSDAIPLTTVGSALDSLGSPIGFTHITAGDPDADGRVSGVTLTAGGLQFGVDSNAGTPAPPTICLGVPFRTDGSGSVYLIARYSNVTGLDANYEQTGVGFGDSDSTAVGDMLFSILFYANGASYLTRSGNTSAGSTTGYQNEALAITLLGETFAGGTAAGEFDRLVNGTIDVLQTISDTAGNPVGKGFRLGQGTNSFGYWITDVTSGGNGLSGVLTSITFIGPNLEMLENAAIPEPATAALLLLGLAALRRRRR
ncbi:MAG TPA: PEP-CTERM sorting domain-containing protein [Planctomycetota bacterium]|nr:PEP-CTERM sorting domain-containing protein [Planctomycetota bacterium]